MKVAVFGASGFVGNAVIERLRLLHPNIETIAVIHSDGNAWALAKDPAIKIKQVNILDKTQVQQVLQGVTHVVNCTRGSDEVMKRGFANLLEEAKRVGVLNFVHLSSVLIYGERPSQDAKDEAGTPNPQQNHYGKLKLYQDTLLQAAVDKGLKANIICPPNIIGPGSYFVDGLLAMLKNGSFTMLENGDYACATVDVNNVAKAIELALLHGNGAGTRYLVTDDQNVTWLDMVNELEKLVGPLTYYRSSKIELEDRTRVAPVSLNPLKSLRHMVSSDVREALRKDPLICKMDIFFRGLVAKLPSSMEDKIRLSVEGHTKIEKVDPLNRINWTFCASQLRNVYHSCDKLKSELGYSPQYSFLESMAAYRQNYNSMRGYDTEFASLLKYLG